MRPFLATALLIAALLAPYPEALAAHEPPYPVYRLHVTIHPETGLLSGKAEIGLPGNTGLTLYTGSLEVLSASSGGMALDASNGATARIGNSLSIEYRGSFSQAAREDATSPENSGVVPSLITPEGVSLTGGWFPELGVPCLYSLSVTLPEGFVAISEADSVTSRATPEGVTYEFSFPHPSQGLSLSAGRYIINSAHFGDTEVLTYLFEEDRDLAEAYLDQTGKYIGLYEAMLGPYPYKRFAVVANFLESGYSMPTYTLLGRRILRLPFMLETSLGHEVLHQWLGNSVLADYARGNWVEGLTTYLADHYYAEREGQGADYRRRALTEYQGQVDPGSELPLRQFTARSDYATRAIGYGKGSMVFHMLRAEIGERAFFDGLREFIQANRFREASWEDLRASIERASGRDLKWFFDQWVDGKGRIGIGLEDAGYRYLHGKARVSFEVRQEGEPMRFKLPVRILTGSGPAQYSVDVEGASSHHTLEVEGHPRAIELDPAFGLMRTLAPGEYPPVIARLMGGRDRLVVIPYDGPAVGAAEGTPPALPDAGIYQPLVDDLLGRGFRAVREDQLKDTELLNSEVLLLGTGGRHARRLFAAPMGSLDEGEGGFMIEVLENPVNPAHVLARALARDEESVAQAAHRVAHYGGYRRLLFEGARVIRKDAPESALGITRRLDPGVYGVRPSGALGLDRIIGEIKDRRIIYLGESHTSFKDHRVQLEVIRALREEGREFAIGMEMFQGPKQWALANYAGASTEEEAFLRESEYFDQWGFDFGYYREILGYAHEHGIPLVALNAERGIITKVARGGLDALSEQERASIPGDLDMSDAGYRERLREVLLAHNRGAGASFTNFYQSQIIWDETMAEGIDRYLKGHPGAQMVVLVGQGHVVHGSGIPKRAHRRNGLSYAVLINSDSGVVEPGQADFVLFSPDVEFAEAPKLGVGLKETEGGLLIETVGEGTPAERAGLRKGDVLLVAGGDRLRRVQDLKIALYDKRVGDKIVLSISRKRFLLGPRVVNVEVEL